MGSAARVVVTCLIVVFLGTGSARAVGYERYNANGTCRTESPRKSKSFKSFQKALQEASFLEKYPAFIDQAAFFVRDILSQFGLVNKKAP